MWRKQLRLPGRGPTWPLAALAGVSRDSEATTCRPWQHWPSLCTAGSQWLGQAWVPTLRAGSDPIAKATWDLTHLPRVHVLESEQTVRRDFRLDQ